jgi:methylthioribose-1-phosphate isomerase
LKLSHPAPLSGATYSAVELLPGDRAALLLDQRRLPHEEHYDEITGVEAMACAIETLAVRGAPAIGVAAAYGMVLAAAEADGPPGPPFELAMAQASERLRRTRPTAVNLAWALDRMGSRVREVAACSTSERLARLAGEARAIHREDVAACRAIGALGATRVPDGATVLTHCNAGALATGGYGTALGVVRSAFARGRKIEVFADETRPFLQGARLTAWELARSKIPVTVITDNMAGHFMARGRIQSVIVGADRIAANGDTANKIGTYAVAVLAQAHDIPFFVAAPRSTIDLAIPDGRHIPIEERAASEVTRLGTIQLAPAEANVQNPAFDVTPARLIAAIITEAGVARPPYQEALSRLCSPTER